MDSFKHPHRAAEQRVRDQAERATAPANSRLPTEKIRKRLGPVAFEQYIAARPLK